jgi:hypothetical protein
LTSCWSGLVVDSASTEILLFLASLSPCGTSFVSASAEYRSVAIVEKSCVSYAVFEIQGREIYMNIKNMTAKDDSKYSTNEF